MTKPRRTVDSLSTQLRRLKKGDILVLRNGLRMGFLCLATWANGRICGAGGGTPYSPGSWFANGKYTQARARHKWDIIRVIKAKPEKKRADEDATWLRQVAAEYGPTFNAADKIRLRKIARRLERGA